MNKHPIIFLDVDGVIVTPRQIHRYVEKFNKPCPPGYAQIDHDCMQVLKRIVRELDAHVVISSTWRKNERDMMDLLKAFCEYEIPMVGYTRSSKDGIRENEIQEYMDEHCLTLNDIIVIDDDTADLKNFADRQIVTNGETGLNYLTDVALAHRIIEGDFRLVVLTEDQRLKLNAIISHTNATSAFCGAHELIKIIDDNRVETVGENFDKSSYSLSGAVRARIAYLLETYVRVSDTHIDTDSIDELLDCLCNSKQIEEK